LAHLGDSKEGRERFPAKTAAVLGLLHTTGRWTMTTRITSGQRKQLVRFYEDGIDGLNLEKDGAQRVIMQGDALQRRCKEIILNFASTFFIPIQDMDVPRKHQPTIVKLRAEARRQAISDSTPLCYRVINGYTLKHHAPKAGPCRENFQYLQNWDFTDEPTVDCLVFWIPRLLPESTGKNVDEQRAHLAEFRNRLELPSHHCSSFGNVALLSGLTLAHYKATGERVPLNGLWTRTDICSVDGNRLELYWDSGSLYCDYWDWDGGRCDFIGIFALGVEPACR